MENTDAGVPKLAPNVPGVLVPVGEQPVSITETNEYKGFMRGTAQRAIMLEPGETLVIPVSENLRTVGFSPYLLDQISAEAHWARQERGSGKVSPTLKESPRGINSDADGEFIEVSVDRGNARELHIARVSPELLSRSQKIANKANKLKVGDKMTVAAEQFDPYIFDRSIGDYLQYQRDNKEEVSWKTEVNADGQIVLECTTPPKKMMR